MDYSRVDSRTPCPVCGREKWCLLHKTGTYAICMHEPEEIFVPRYGGWKHWLPEPVSVTIPPPPEPKDWQTLLRSYTDNVRELAREWDVNLEVLLDLGIRWDVSKGCFAIPVKLWNGDVVGVQRQWLDGTKRFMSGSKPGLFYPDNVRYTAVAVCEGASDTAVAMHLGFPAIGRVSASQSANQVTMFRADRYYIVADNDEAGQIGARRLQSRLTEHGKWNTIITPPEKDLRAFYQEAGYKEAKQWLGDVWG